MNPIAEDILMHYGVKRRSGRYPWGSGENPYQHGGDFLARVEELEAMGKSQKEIAEELKMSTTDLRMQVRVAKHERRALQAERAKSLREEGKTLDEIAKIMGYNNDSSVRALLNENTASNKNKALATAEALKKELAVKGALDVGEGVEQQLGVSKGVLQEALFILETEGYNRYGVGVPQVNDPKKRTITPVISVPDIEQRDAYQNLDIIKSVGDYHSSDGGASWDKREYPASIDSSRVKVLYGDEGGSNKDGVIEIRRGVADLDLGNAHYAQVRILVDGTHYPDLGTTMNCTFCTTAMALREKGYDVQATKVSDGFFSDDFFKATFNSPEVKMGRKKSGQAVLDTLSQTGDGSYGNLTVAWKLGGKHSLFWKNEGGRTRIYDGQSGEEITQSPSKTRSFMDFVNLKTITYNRLDNCEPTTYALAAVERPKKM